MENRLRDLEQIRERDSDDSARRVGLIALASISVVAVIFALGVVIGRAASTESDRSEDPLARIDNLNRFPDQPKSEKPVSLRVHAEELSFPSVLTQKQDPPEVAAAVAAAAAEEAVLNSKLARQTETISETPRASVVLQTPQIPRIVMNAADTKSVTNPGPVAQQKAIVTLPIKKTSSYRDPAPVGREGEYTIQVISYERREPANAFATGLRSRGHHAFVVGVNVPDRGTYWRVRIGPFDSKWEADEYRRKFEQEERLNVIVVRKEKS